MEKDTIITLEDHSVYVLLDEMIQDEKKYFFATKMDKEKNTPTTEYEIFEEINENDETYMETIENEDFKQTIILEFLKKYMDEENNIEEEI